MATKIKKPKALKYPKRPKGSASIAVWERYDARCKEVEKENHSRDSQYKKALSQREADKKKKAAIQKKYTGGLAGMRRK